MKGTEILKEAREEGGSMEEHLTTGREGGYPATVASALAEDSPSVRVPGLPESCGSSGTSCVAVSI